MQKGGLWYMQTASSGETQEWSHDGDIMTWFLKYVTTVSKVGCLHAPHCSQEKNLPTKSHL